MKAFYKKLNEARANLPASEEASSTRANLPASATSKERAAELRSWEAHLKKIDEDLEDRELAAGHVENDLHARAKELADLEEEFRGSKQRWELALDHRSQELDAKGARVLEAEAAVRDNPANLSVATAAISNLHRYMHGRKGLSKAAIGWIDRIKAALDS